MGSATRNYHAHGGNEWVVGGKLTFLPGAIVEGTEGLFDSPDGGAQPLPFMADSEATTVAALREDHNRLLPRSGKLDSWLPRPPNEVIRRGDHRPRGQNPSAH